MRVVHSGAVNFKSGGPALSTWLTIKGLRRLGVDAQVLAAPISSDDKIISEKVNPIFTQNSILPPFAYVPGLAKLLASLPLADLYHIQGIWMMHGCQVARFAQKQSIPYVVTLRGMLYPQALAHHSLQKRLSLAMYQRAVLRNASAIQCTCVEEMEHYRALGFTNPGAIIPNPIEIEPLSALNVPVNSAFRIGYLGRIHPRKRVERLIRAIHYLKSHNIAAELVIIGSGDSDYEKLLRHEVEKLGLANEVRFAGFLTGKQKDEAIESLSLLVVPSDFENFGNIVTEALVHGVPVIASKGTPWQGLETHDCGWWVDNDQDSINTAILRAHSVGNDILHKMGMNGRLWMQSDFSVEALGAKMLALYKYILGEGDKPEFVYE